MSVSTCEHIGGDLVAFLDGELRDEERQPIAAHLASCLVCRRELDRLTTVRGWIGALPAVEPGPTFAADFWRRVASPVDRRRVRNRSCG